MAVVPSLRWNEMGDHTEDRVIQWLGLTDEAVPLSWVRAARMTAAAAPEAEDAPDIVSPRFIKQLGELGEVACAVLSARDVYIEGERRPGALTDVCKTAADTWVETLTDAAPIRDGAKVGHGERAEVETDSRSARRVDRALALQLVGAVAVSQRLGRLRSRIGTPPPEPALSREVPHRVPRKSVTHTCELMRLEMHAEALVAEALVHPSWAEENRYHGTRPASCEALAALGAWTMRYWALRTRLVESTRTGRRPEVSSSVDLGAGAIAALGRAAGIEPLVGRGLQGRVSDRVMADTTQALAGAVVVSTGVDPDQDAESLMFQWLTTRDLVE